MLTTALYHYDDDEMIFPVSPIVFVIIAMSLSGMKGDKRKKKQKKFR